MQLHITLLFALLIVLMLGNCWNSSCFIRHLHCYWRMNCAMLSFADLCNQQLQKRASKYLDMNVELKNRISNCFTKTQNNKKADREETDDRQAAGDIDMDSIRRSCLLYQCFACNISCSYIRALLATFLLTQSTSLNTGTIFLNFECVKISRWMEHSVFFYR